MPTWLIWALLPLLLAVAIGGGVMTVAATFAAVHPKATWPQTHYASVKAGVFGSFAVTAVLVLMRIWP